MQTRCTHRIVLRGLLAVLFTVSGAVSAQDTACPVIVSDALAAVDSACEATGRNQACYGNVTLAAEAQAGVDDLVFETPGDIVNVANIRSLALSPMDETVPEWGVSLMQLQANLPDTLPGQNVTVLLFGDVAIENAVDEFRFCKNVVRQDGFFEAAGVED